MKALIIYAHPNPISFNAALAEIVQEEMEQQDVAVKVKDLYGMDFNPILGEEDFKALRHGHVPEDIREEQSDIIWADLLVVVAPVWWFSFPAILKGYFDRIFSVGFAYENTPTGMRGLLEGKRALVITTSGADEDRAAASGTLDILGKTISGIFGKSGFAGFDHINLFAVPSISDEERKAMLVNIRDTVANWIQG